MNKKTNFKKSNIIFIALALFMLIFSISSTLAVPMQTINDSNVYISAQSTREGSGYVPIIFIPKFSNQIDVAFGFNVVNSYPSSLELFVNNYTRTIGPYAGVITENWTTITPSASVNYNYDGKTKWYMFNNLNVQANKTYMLRMYLNVLDNGKYDIAMKLSSDTITNAITNNRFYFLDPEFNVTQTINLNQTYPNSDSSYSHRNGIAFYAFKNATLRNITMDGAVNANQIAIQLNSTAPNGATLKTCTPTGSMCDLNYQVTAGTVYRLSAYNGGSAFTRKFSNSPGNPFPPPRNYSDVIRVTTGIDASTDNSAWVSDTVDRTFHFNTIQVIWTNITVNVVTVTFDKQVPTNITSTNILNSPINITYNISSANPINTTTLYYNVTPCSYVLGNLSCGVLNTTNTSNINSTYKFNLFDNQIYPATYSFLERNMENTIHSNQSIGGNANAFIKNNLTNVTNSTYSFLEIMTHNTSLTGLTIYVCNSSYSTGSVSGSSSCAVLTVLMPAEYNHCHSNFSCHHVIPFPIINNNINGIGITNKMYILPRGGDGWLYFNIANDTGTMQTTGNGGVTWSAVPGTMDSHLHQFGNTTSLLYWACANDTSSGACSSVTSQIIGLSSLPPSQPIVIAPNSSSVLNQTFTIQYLPSNSLTSNISYYSLNLYDTSFNLLSLIYGNNDGNLTFKWNVSTLANGNYRIGVTANTNDNQSATGFSDIFEIANPVPPPPPKTTSESIDEGVNLFGYILLLLGAMFAYSFYAMLKSKSGEPFPFLLLVSAVCLLFTNVLDVDPTLRFVASLLAVVVLMIMGFDIIKS